MQHPALAVSRAYDFSLWIVNKVEHFPRSLRPLLGDRLINASLDLLLALVQASFASNKTQLLDSANAQLHSLRYLLRLAKDCKLISLDSYAFAAENCENIGRMVGGWRKQSLRTPREPL